MKVFYNGSAPNMMVTASPASHLPAAECPKDWFEEDGTTPRQISVQFKDGAVVLEAPLARYLVAQKIARTSKIMMPGDGHQPLVLSA